MHTDQVKGAYGVVERNLREMFRCLAVERARGEVKELAGVSIVSAGTDFQMFNAGFLNSPVADRLDLERRIGVAGVAFRARGLPWSLWVCEEMLPADLRRPLGRICERARLYLASEMPAMAAEEVVGGPVETGLRICPVENDVSLRDFRRVGAACFRVPPPWFDEIFDRTARVTDNPRAWVGYFGGHAVSTAVTVSSTEAVGLYNLATLNSFRERGFGEAMFRHAIERTLAAVGPKPLVLQSTRQGLRLYERLGFRTVGRILVFTSG